MPAAVRSLAPASLTERLRLMFEWYEGMISPRTGRLLYSYEPGNETSSADGSPIRDIAAIWDVELLSRFVGRSELLPLLERSLRHYAGYLVSRDGALVLDPQRLGEPSGIAHSAFMVLALLSSSLPEREVKITGLADGIVRQQRPDGSYRIYFGGEPDDGLELYPGEAMLALMEGYASLQESRYLSSVERGFEYQRRRVPPAALAADYRVFYANWQSQYAAPLHASTSNAVVRRAVRDHVFALHDRIVEGGLYEAIEQHPAHQATVEVACALEGLNDAYTIAVRESDSDRITTYGGCIQTALAWLGQAQRLDHCTARERGGFGHSLRDRTQRIDVTGHVAAGFIKSVRNGIATSLFT
ncbi:MAG TPA: hypothetical protein VH439_07905 [Gemmatimonadales bacterium]